MGDMPIWADHTLHDNNTDTADSARTYVHPAPARNGARRRLPSPYRGFEPIVEPRRPDQHAQGSATARGEDAVMRALAVPPNRLRAARTAALAHGTDLASELIAAGDVDMDALAEAAAAHLGLPFEAIAAGDRIVGKAAAGQFGLPKLLKTCNERLVTKVFMVPRLENLDGLALLLSRLPRLRAMARITTSAELKRAVAHETLGARLEAATLGLAPRHPRFSARTVVEAGQATSVLLLLFAFAVCLVEYTSTTFAALHALAAILFGACLVLRLAAVLSPATDLRRDRQPGEIHPHRTKALPSQVPLYSVLVALYQESSVVERLVGALDKLDWPKSCIEIKLVCEEDDRLTIAAVERAVAGRAHFEIVLVPPSYPRTKPKALNFALPLTAGEFLVLYDAEDEPDPGQLKEAYHAFRTGPEELAALQAPLVIRNGARNWLSGLFALEYAALFRRLLPWLARFRMPLPLGGTSNHFVRQHLVEIGGWDSHNVTEDADLGMRLKRNGFYVGTLTLPTFEDAPEVCAVWLRQRTRWCKGWLQTWLVHMRQPLRLIDEIGFRDFVVFQLLFIGLVISGIGHPVFLLALAFGLSDIFTSGWPQGAKAMLLALDLFNAVGGIALFLALSYQALTPIERRTLPRSYPMILIYWPMIAFATLRAVWQLATNPHQWEKTPHDLRSRADIHDLRYRIDPEFAQRPDGGRVA